MEEMFDLKRLLYKFYEKKNTIIFITLLFLFFGTIYLLLFSKPLYINTIKLKLSNDATANRISSYNDFIKSSSFIDAAIKSSGIKSSVTEVKKGLSLSAGTGSKIYTITLKYKYGNEGSILCEEIAKSFVNKINLYDGSTASIQDKVSTSSFMKTVVLYVVKKEVIFGIIGLIIGLGYIFVIYYFSSKIKSQNELVN